MNKLKLDDYFEDNGKHTFIFDVVDPATKDKLFDTFCTNRAGLHGGEDFEAMRLMIEPLRNFEIHAILSGVEDIPYEIELLAYPMVENDETLETIYEFDDLSLGVEESLIGEIADICRKQLTANQ